jgi:hypothetical protein
MSLALIAFGLFLLFAFVGLIYEMIFTFLSHDWVAFPFYFLVFIATIVWLKAACKTEGGMGK